nr:hypothetical protein Q903MT_gene3028 [Picea sitchensis]
MIETKTSETYIRPSPILEVEGWGRDLSSNPTPPAKMHFFMTRHSSCWVTLNGKTVEIRRRNVLILIS